MAESAAQDSYRLVSRSTGALGYGAAATWSLPVGFRLKASYEKAFRLPTIEEMFGDEDLEVGDVGIKPESSHNLNLNLGFSGDFGRSNLFVEAGLIFRDTRDYIQRNILSLGGGKSAATYVNYGRVETKGFSISARYCFADWLSVGGNFTRMDVRDNMRYAMGSSAENISYRERMPNLPYLFADSDVNFYWRGIGREGNLLTLSYDNQFTRAFCYYASNIGADRSDYMVPDQLAHNLTLSFGFRDGRYNLSLECRNLTNVKLYDNFSLQKPGRAFYVKFRICFSN